MAASDDKIVRATLNLIEAKGWTALTMSALAKAAKISVAALYEKAPNKAALLKLILQSFDREIIARLTECDPRTPVKDRVFDVVLNVFEALGPRKPVLRVLYHDLRYDPAAWIGLWRGLKQTSSWLAEAADIGVNGIAGALKLRGIALLLTDAAPIWLDDGADLGKTMAHIDRRLRRFEQTMRFFRRKPAEAEDARDAAESEKTTS
jgi:AcrR family transcriptional regulator